MDTETEIAVISAAAFLVMACGMLLKKQKRPRTRRWWMMSLNQSRETYSGTDLMMEMLKEPSGLFDNFCRMSNEDFLYLLSGIEPMIMKKDTRWRKAIPANERLAITLRFLATGDSFKSLHYLFKVSAQLISEIVPEVCRAIIKVLQGYVKMPKTCIEWKRVAAAFENQWNFPHCIGAIDGKHVTIQAPFNSGSEYYNYKNNFSVVLMGLVDADYNFKFADCGCQGRLSDGAVFRNTKLFQKIEENDLHCPPPEPLTGRNMAVPYVFVGDDAFGLMRNIMKPFSGKHDVGSKPRVYNYRLCRTRRVVENAFGILANVFRSLRKPMLLQPDKVALVVMTCVVLHNFLRRSKSSRSLYFPVGSVDFEEEGRIVEGSCREMGSDRTSLLPMRNIPRRAGLEAKEITVMFVAKILHC